MDKYTFLFYARLIKTGFKQAFTLKKVFWMRILFMVLNNLVMLFAWSVMFKQFNTINGWGFNDFIFMTGLVVSTFAVWPIFFRGIGIHMMRLIENGELDSYMIQPRRILFSIGCSVCDPSGFGDLISGLILIVWSGLLTPASAFLVLILFILATLTFLAINILVSCLPFFIKGSSELGERLFYMFFSVAGYPGSIYTGTIKMAFCSIFPVGLISVLPVELLNKFSWPVFGYLAGMSIFLFSLSVFLFNKGLKRYESGNRFNVHG